MVKEITDHYTGEVLSSEDIEFAYTREGRRIVGREYPNPVPMEPPIGHVESEPLHLQIRRMIEQDVSRRAQEAEEESFEDADDFDVGDDYEPESPYELDFEPDDPWPPSKAVLAHEQAAAAAAAADGGAGGRSPQAPSSPNGEPVGSPGPAAPPSGASGPPAKL